TNLGGPGMVGVRVIFWAGAVGIFFFLHVFENFSGVALERVAVAGAAAAETEEDVAFVINFGGAGDQLHIPISLDGVIFEDGAEIHGQRGVGVGILFEQIGFANADAGDGRGSVAAEKRLAEGNFAAVAHAHGN